MRIGSQIEITPEYIQKELLWTISSSQLKTPKGVATLPTTPLVWRGPEDLLSDLSGLSAEVTGAFRNHLIGGLTGFPPLSLEFTQDNQAPVSDVRFGSQNEYTTSKAPTGRHDVYSTVTRQDKLKTFEFHVPPGALMAQLPGGGITVFESEGAYLKILFPYNIREG